jgi:hypothetical protein
MTFTLLTPAAEEIAIIRTLIPDNDAIFGAGANEYLFEDAQIINFYTVARGGLLRSAAYACLAIGSSEALINKKIIEQDLATDGAAVAESFLNNAKLLLARADIDDSLDAELAFTIVDFNPIPYPYYGRGAELSDPLYPFGGEPTNMFP